MTANRTARRAAVAFAALLAAAASLATRAQERLTLSIDDMEAAPGDTAVLVVRSYQPRPISQGQLCFGIGAPRFSSIRRAHVLSTRHDATFEASLASPNEAAMTMSSPTASINDAEGPVLVIAFIVDPAATPGDSFELTIQLPDSILTDPNGAPIDIDVKPGTFTVKQPDAPHTIEADNADAAAGSTVILDIATAEYRPLSHGQVDYRYDATIIESIESIRVLSLKNDAVFMANTSRPGRVLITFSSPSRTIAKIPGQFIQLTARVRPGLPNGLEGPLAIAPGHTFLVANDGTSLPLVVDNGNIEIKNR
jgi:hypothetical protein